jgi:hypothetical protein
VSHRFDWPTLGGYGGLIATMDDLVKQLRIPLERAHCFIEPGLEGHVFFLL